MGDSRFTFSPVVLDLLTKVPSNKCEQPAACRSACRNAAHPFLPPAPFNKLLERKRGLVLPPSASSRPGRLRNGTERHFRRRHLWIFKHRMTYHFQRKKKGESQNPASVESKAVQSSPTDAAFSNDSLFPFSTGGSICGHSEGLRRPIKMTAS